MAGRRAHAMTFHLGKIPVRVQPSFFVVVVLLNLASTPLALVTWAAVVFVSVLLHELGHASAGLAFGLEPRVELHGMGGTTSWREARPLPRWQRIAISLAGPGAGFAVGGLATAAWAAGLVPATETAALVYREVRFVNVSWGLLNLLPMLPMDGGNVLAQVLDGATHGRGERPARVVSIVVAAISAVAALALLHAWPALLAISFAVLNWRGLRALSTRERDAALRSRLAEAYRALDERDGQRVLDVARPVALASRTADVRAEALQLVAFGFLLSGRVHDADAAIAAMPEGYQPHPSLLEMRAAAGG